MINELKNEIEEVREVFLKEVELIQSQGSLRILKDRYVSRKKGILSGLLNRLKEMPVPEKPAAGKVINELKFLIEDKIKDREKALGAVEERAVDFSLPGIDLPLGRAHLLSIIRKKIEDIFLNMGYEIAYGPEIETEYHNFTALNFQENHPARDEQDTFFIKDFPGKILRTHTSPVQIRYMLRNKPPIKIISPGKVFRKDEPDATHTPVFHQVEGLLVDKGVNFSHLKGTLELFIKSFFGEHIQLRFRPSYFPFTEPSAEVDINCFLCFGKDANCKICKGGGWLEILGSGMVHPQVLKNCDIDPEIYAGFAFGMGIERVALLKHEVMDLRMFYENDLRFITQFG